MAGKRLHTRLYHLFYDPRARYFVLVNDILALATIVSVLALILETLPSLSGYTGLWYTIEFVSVAIFTTEYVARIIAHKGQVGRYIFSFFGIVDLVAIVPSFIGLTNLTFLKTTRTLRILRLLRMLRLAKLANTVGAESKTRSNTSLISVQIYAAALSTGLILFGTLMYLVEGESETFVSIPHAMLWAAKVTLGGVPIASPSTLAGDVLMLCTRFFGLLLFGLLIAITGKGLERLLFGKSSHE